MTTSPEPARVKMYYIQHIQTGSEFRSADLTAVTQWMTAQNLDYITNATCDTAEEAQ